MRGLMKPKQSVFPPRVSTTSEVIGWIESTLAGGEEIRSVVDVMAVTGDAQVADVRKLYDSLLMVHGSVSGMTAMAYATGRIEGEAFLAFNKRALALIADKSSLWTPR